MYVICPQLLFLRLKKKLAIKFTYEAEIFFLTDVCQADLKSHDSIGGQVFSDPDVSQDLKKKTPVSDSRLFILGPN